MINAEQCLCYRNITWHLSVSIIDSISYCVAEFFVLYWLTVFVMYVALLMSKQVI